MADEHSEDKPMNEHKHLPYCCWRHVAFHVLTLAAAFYLGFSAFYYLLMVTR